MDGWRSSRAIVRGAAQLSLAELAGPVVQAVELLAVSRALGPDALGRWVYPALALGLGTTVLELGLHAVIARRRVSNERMLIRRWTGVVLATHALAAVVALAVGASFALPLAFLLAATALLVAGAGARAALVRAGRFAVVARIELSGTLLHAVVTVGLALAGAEVWALVAGAAARQWLVMVCLRRAAPAAEDPRAAPAALIGEATLVVATFVVIFLAANLDYLVAGRYLDRAELATYFVAFSVAVVPVMRVGSAATRVLLPALGPVSDRGVWPGAADRALRAAMLTGATVTALTVVAAEWLPTLLGERWDEVVRPTRLLATVAMAVMARMTLRTAALALRNDRTSLVAGLAWAGLTAVLLLAVGATEPRRVAVAVGAATIGSVVLWAATIPRWLRPALLGRMIVAVVLPALLLGTEALAAWGRVESGAATAVTLLVAAGLLVAYRRTASAIGRDLLLRDP